MKTLTHLDHWIYEDVDVPVGLSVRVRVLHGIKAGRTGVVDNQKVGKHGVEYRVVDPEAHKALGWFPASALQPVERRVHPDAKPFLARAVALLTGVGEAD